jgi:Protein of unknown function (DUF3768)
MGTKVDKTKRIRELNDTLRRTFMGGQVMLTSGVDALPADVKAKVLEAVRSFDAFDGDNDPHKEHDFGAFEMSNERFFWKVDYYNRNMAGGSEDPADPKETSRVLTIMFASEY